MPTNKKSKSQAEMDEMDRLDAETCMCGGLIKDHTGWDGHTPVSMLDYYGSGSEQEGESDADE